MIMLKVKTNPFVGARLTFPSPKNSKFLFGGRVHYPVSTGPVEGQGTGPTPQHRIWRGRLPSANCEENRFVTIYRGFSEMLGFENCSNMREKCWA